MPEPGADELVSLAEAARRLGIGERRARRIAAGLSDTDVQVVRDGHGRALRLVRLGALGALLQGEATAAATDTERPTRTAPSRTVGAVSDRSAVLDAADQAARLTEAEKRAAVAEARAELLERERNDWHAQAAALAARLEDADARLAAVLASTGRLQIGTQEGAVEPDPGPGGESAARDGDGASAGRLEAAGASRPSWWARLWGRG